MEEMEKRDGEQVEMEAEQRGPWHHHMRDMCKRYQHYLVVLEGNDGSMIEGIIDGWDDDHVYLLVPIGDQDDGYDRQFGLYGYPYGYPYGFYGPPYGYPRRFRRFRRHFFPFFGLRRLFFPIFY